MVGPEHCAFAIHVFKHQSAFVKRYQRRYRLKQPLPVFVIHLAARLQHKRKQPEIVRLHLTYGLGRSYGMRSRALLAGKPQYCRKRYGKARLFRPLPRKHYLGGGSSLVYALKHPIIARFKAHVQQIYSGFMQQLKLAVRLYQYALWRCIHAYPFTFRKDSLYGIKYNQLILSISDKSVPIGKEYAPYPVGKAARRLKVGDNVLSFSYPEALFLIHRAKSAAVVAAPYRRLHYKAERLAWRAEYPAFIKAAQLTFPPLYPPP